MQRHGLIFILAAAFIILPSSCSRNSDCTVAVSLNLGYDLEMAQSAPVELDTKAGDGGWQYRYIVRLFKYDESGKYSLDPEYSFTFTREEGLSPDNSLEIRVEPAPYRVIVWTDYVLRGSEEDLYYSTEDFGKVSLLLPAYTGSDPRRDCFFGSGDLLLQDKPSGKAEADINMTSPLARYDFISTDRERFVKYVLRQRAAGGTTKSPLYGIDLDGYHVKVSYQQFLPSAFSLHSGRPVDSVTGVNYSTNMQVREDGTVLLGFDYVFANESSTKIVVALDFFDGDWNLINSADDITIPLTRNSNTSVRGEMLTRGIEEGVVIDPFFDGEYNLEI